MSKINIEPFRYEIPPKIVPSQETMNSFAKMHQLIASSSSKEIIFDMTQYDYIHPIYAVLVASLIYLGDHYDKKVSIQHNPNNEKSRNFFGKAGIFEHFNQNMIEFNDDNQVGFRRFYSLEQTYETVNAILDTAPVKLEPKLRASLFSKICEIFSNSFTHANSEIGVFCCGYINDQNDFSFSVYDAGIGVYENVKNYVKEYPEQYNGGKLDYAASLEWAFNSGNSTQNGKVDYPRGAGLHLLESFVKANKGNIYFTSQAGYCLIKENERKFVNLSNELIGTIFSMSIKADNNHIYCLNG